jgi:protein-disulfide isomerase
VGGAERAERRRRQRATKSPTGPRSGAAPVVRSDDGRRRIVVVVVVVGVLAAAVIGGVLWQRSRSGPGPAEAHRVDASYPVQLDGGVVVAGEDSAKVTVDVYEDFLCPACGAFEQRDGGRIDEALAAGRIKVRYHVVNILDELSNPPGYSTDAGNAALCAADAGQFPSYHASLFAKQPREGGRGYSIDQLVQLGRDVGITDPAFEPCVRNGQHDGDVRAQEQAASGNTALHRTFPGGRSGFATPTVVIDGKIVDTSEPAWLDDAVAGAG